MSTGYEPTPPRPTPPRPAPPTPAPNPAPLRPAYSAPCVFGFVVLAFFVIFFGTWAGEEAFRGNHESDTCNHTSYADMVTKMKDGLLDGSVDPADLLRDLDLSTSQLEKLKETVGILTQNEIPFNDIPSPESVDRTRKALLAFVKSTSKEQQDQFYFKDASKQPEQWRICTIVQQCAKPPFAISSGNLTDASRGMFFDAMADLIPQVVYHVLMLQLMSNMLLGEYQAWAERCPGDCRQLTDTQIADGVTFDEKNILEANPNPELTTFKACGDQNVGNKKNKRVSQQTTYWVCKDRPRLGLYGNVDTSTGVFQMNNIFKENKIHARTNQAEFISVYGDLKGTGQFGFRFTGHHVDINYIVHADGSMDTVPSFAGHNPIAVMENHPARINKNHNEKKEYYFEADDYYSLWKNMAGIQIFPAVSERLTTFVQLLTTASYVPLNQFDSTPDTGGLTLKDSKTIDQVAHIDLTSTSGSFFETFWKLVVYTAPALYTGDIEEEFRNAGKLLWTTVNVTKQMSYTSPGQLIRADGSFVYIQAETDKYLYFMLLNKLFTVGTLKEPSNHLHSLFIKKSYLKNPKDIKAWDDPYLHVH